MRLFLCHECGNWWESAAESSCPNCGSTIQVDEYTELELAEFLAESQHNAEQAMIQGMRYGF